jgi:elongation factor P
LKASELEKGMIIKEGDEFLVVINIDHKTPGNLRAIYQVTLKNLLKGNMINRRFSPSDNVEKVDLESKKFQYLYSDHSGYHFMDMENYESIALDRALIGQNKDFLKENLEVLVFYNGHDPISFLFA